MALNRDRASFQQSKEISLRKMALNAGKYINLEEHDRAKKALSCYYIHKEKLKAVGTFVSIKVELRQPILKRVSKRWMNLKVQNISFVLNLSMLINHT